MSAPTRINDPYPATTQPVQHTRHDDPVVKETITYDTPLGVGDSRRNHTVTYQHRTDDKHPRVLVFDAASVFDAGIDTSSAYTRACLELYEAGHRVIILDDGVDRDDYTGTGLTQIEPRLWFRTFDDTTLVDTLDAPLDFVGADHGDAVVVTSDITSLVDVVGAGCIVWLCPDNRHERNAQAMMSFFD